VPLEPDDLDVAGREGGALGGQIFARDEAGARRLVRGEGGGVRRRSSTSGGRF
jgi:hypothetical protein